MFSGVGMSGGGAGDFNGGAGRILGGGAGALGGLNKFPTHINLLPLINV